MFGNGAQDNNAFRPTFRVASPSPFLDDRVLHISAKDGRSVFDGLTAVVLPTVISDDALDDAVGAQIRKYDAVGRDAYRGQQIFWRVCRSLPACSPAN
jgi:hypothetical protein